MNKYCPKCNLNKALSEFYQRKIGSRSGEYYGKCKDCMKKRGINYYHANHERQLGLALIRRRRARVLKRNYLDDVKANIPCQDCGLVFPPYCMDYDHRDRNDKISSIGSMTGRNWTLKRIQAEIDKCDLVCANCHRIRTYLRKDYLKIKPR